jgi:hypothetical protein
MNDGPLVIRISGMENIRANLRNLMKAPEQFGQAAREWGDDRMMESQAECPYDFDNPHSDGTPHLRDTALVEGPIFEGDSFIIRFSYDQSYAAIQHETPEYRHLWPTKWKYLEDPINRGIPRFATAMIRRLEMILQGVNERMEFSSPYAVRRDYEAAQRAFAAANIASAGHLVGRFV